MPRPRKRHSRPVTTPRFRTLRHGQRILDALKANPHVESVDKLENAHIYASEVKPGFQRLYSRDVPGVQADDYIASVSQNIDSGAGWTKPVENSQSYHVQGPRFTLPEDAIYSVYPPKGHEVNNDVLPHVVFTDPTTPWERIGSIAWEKTDPKDHAHNRVPWLALLTFTADELAMDGEQLKKMFGDDAESRALVRQADELHAEVVANDVRKLNPDNVSGPTYSDSDMTDATSKSVRLIFPKAQLFNDIFSAYADDGERIISGAPDLSRHRFLAHVRKVNVEGMADADSTEDTVERDFGIIVSNRSAPTFFEKPQSIYVHLVALEKLEDIRPFPIPPTAKDNTERRVCLVSLHSWTYTCLPPESIDVKTRLETLRDSIAPLRPSLPPPTQDLSPAKLRAMQRIKDGYSLVRYRTKTGEETVAFTRGPLIPSIVDKRDNMQSNSGSNFLIMDRELGIMDITYSTAWNLGRTMALADRAYTTALTRVRGQILGPAVNESKKRVLKACGQMYGTKVELLTSLQESLASLHEISSPDVISAQSVGAQHWRTAESEIVDLSYASKLMSLVLDEELEQSASRVSSTSDVPDSHPIGAAPPIYDEYNMPSSVDWMVVLRFILDLYHLVNVPAHYLLTDPSHLPHESLRFFMIDQNWIDALVDGALSLGNQIDPLQDKVRIEIKRRINQHLDTTDPTRGYKPPLPKFGFFMRSVVVTQFPDLKVEVSPEISRTLAPVLLSHNIVAQDTMLGFFSELPATDALRELTFTLPCHQQYFYTGIRFKREELEINFKRINTHNGVDYDPPVPLSNVKWPREGPSVPAGHPVIYKWGNSKEDDDIRILLVDKFAADVHKTLTEEWKALGKPAEWYTEPYATSAIMGIQMNVAALMFRVSLPKSQTSGFPSSLLTYPTSPPSPPSSSSASTAKFERPEKVSRSPVPTLEMRTRAAPLPHELPRPPHHKRIIPAEMLDPPSEGPHSRSASISSFVLVTPPPAHDSAVPQFFYSAHPSSSPKSAVIPLTPSKQDLIISIIRDPSIPPAEFQLSSMIISLPCRSDSVPNLTDDDTEISAAMVSNLRFNVRVAYSKIEKAIQLRILPRSRREWVWVGDVKEMSVQLYGVRVVSSRKGGEKGGRKVVATARPGFTYGGAPGVGYEFGVHVGVEPDG